MRSIRTSTAASSVRVVFGLAPSPYSNNHELSVATLSGSLRAIPFHLRPHSFSTLQSIRLLRLARLRHSLGFVPVMVFVPPACFPTRIAIAKALCSPQYKNTRQALV